MERKEEVGMKPIEEIIKDARLRNIKEGQDGGSAEIHIGGWSGSVIWSWECGFEHVSVAPYMKRIVPQWDDMCNIKDMFWKEDEDVVQIHPKKINYVNNVSNCLHLWRCTYCEMPLPPSCLVGLRKGQTLNELKEEIKKASIKAAMLMDKEWRDIKGYEGVYQVSDKGHVRAANRLDANGLRREGRMIELILSNSGYYVVTLTKNGKGKQFRVHRLVAEAFIPNPNKLSMINHKDENRTNNCVENLEWCDVTYNNNYGSRLNKVAMKLGKPIVGKNLVTGEEKFYFSQGLAARDLHISSRGISKVICGERSKYKGWEWRNATEEEVKAAYELAGEKYE